MHITLHSYHNRGNLDTFVIYPDNCRITVITGIVNFLFTEGMLYTLDELFVQGFTLSQYN